MAETATVVETAPNPTEGSSAPVVVAPPAPAEGKPAEQPATESLLFSDDTKTPPAEVKPPAGAPEKYEFKAPEGTTYDPQVIEDFSAAAKEANLTQDAAQKLIAKMAPAIAQRQQAQIDAVQRQWVEASRADKEFGGDKLKANLSIAKRAMETFASPGLVELLKDSGLGNHPEVIRHFIKVGTSISEDGHVTGSPGPQAVQYNDFASIADALYPPKG